MGRWRFAEGDRGPPSVLLDSHPLRVGIALAGGVAERQGALDLCELGLGQIDLSRGGAFLKMGGGATAGDRHNMWRFGERPGDGQGRRLQSP